MRQDGADEPASSPPKPQSSPEFVDVRRIITRGQGAIDAGDPASALSYLNEARRHSPDDLEVLMALGKCLNDLGRYDEALKVDLDATRLAPRSALAHLRLGITYYRLRQYELSLRTLDTSKSLSHADPEPFVWGFQVYRALKQPESSRKELAEAVARGLGLERLHCGLGDLLYDEGKYAEALDQFRVAESISPTSIETKFRLGRAHILLDDPQAAFAYLQEVACLRPRWAEAWFRLGEAQFGLRNYARAIDALEQAKALRKNHCATLRLLAASYLNQGQLRNFILETWQFYRCRLAARGSSEYQESRN